ALFNHILPSQDPASGMVLYYCPLRPGAWKSFSTPDDSFWCCVGTGMENHAKYGDTIYFHDRSSLYVNLFIPSELTWKDRGLVVRQQTRFPEEAATHLSMTLAQPARVAVKVRQPAWARGASVRVNGRDWQENQDRQDGQDGRGRREASYLTNDREWKSGDTIDGSLPVAPHNGALT